MAAFILMVGVPLAAVLLAVLHRRHRVLLWPGRLLVTAIGALGLGIFLSTTGEHADCPPMMGEHYLSLAMLPFLAAGGPPAARGRRP